jgi:hypothetical protein
MLFTGVCPQFMSDIHQPFPSQSGFLCIHRSDINLVLVFRVHFTPRACKAGNAKQGSSRGSLTIASEPQHPSLMRLAELELNLAITRARIAPSFAGYGVGNASGTSTLGLRIDNNNSSTAVQMMIITKNPTVARQRDAAPLFKYHLHLFGKCRLRTSILKGNSLDFQFCRKGLESMERSS